MVKAKEIFATALKELRMTQAQVASIVGMPEQSIGQKINVRESIKANEFFDLLEAIGIETVFYIKETGEQLLRGEGDHRRVTGMSDGVIYDTKDSKLIASSFYADGVHEFSTDGKAHELYLDRENRYFVAEYSVDGSSRDRVRSVSSDIAEAFISRYGDVRNRNS